MSFRVIGLALCAGVFAFATGTLAQNAPQTTANSNLTLAQATTADTPAKPAKSKVKKPKTSQGTGNSAAGSPQPAPHVGPPDPGKY